MPLLTRGPRAINVAERRSAQDSSAQQQRDEMRGNGYCSRLKYIELESTTGSTLETLTKLTK